MLRAPLDQAIAQAAEDPAARARIAAWHRSLGQAVQAARWQRWVVLPPPGPELDQALRELRLDLRQADDLLEVEPEQGPCWARLEALLQADQLDEARTLQSALLRDPPSVHEARFLAIAELWQAHEQPDAALALLLTLAQQHSQAAGWQPPVPLANAIAALQERVGDAAQAEVWWAASLRQLPGQPAVLMRMARLAEARQHWRHVFHYCRQVLELDPLHPWALALQLECLVGMSAPGSLQRALEQWPLQLPEQPVPPHLLAASTAALEISPEVNEPEALGLDQLRPFGEILLVGSRLGAALRGALPRWGEERPRAVILALESPEPLLLEQSLRSAIPSSWQLLQRPELEPELLKSVELVLIETPAGLPLPEPLQQWLSATDCPQLRWHPLQRQWRHAH